MPRPQTQLSGLLPWRVAFPGSDEQAELFARVEIGQRVRRRPDAVRVPRQQDAVQESAPVVVRKPADADRGQRRHDQDVVRNEDGAGRIENVSNEELRDLRAERAHVLQTFRVARGEILPHHILRVVRAEHRLEIDLAREDRQVADLRDYPTSPATAICGRSYTPLACTTSRNRTGTNR